MNRSAPITALLAVALIAAYGLELANGGYSVCKEYGFVAANPSVQSAVSAMFLHDPESLFHLGGNLIFLVVFGVIVERAIGSLGFALLYGLAGLGGAGLHCLVAGNSSVPLVGASGALFGLLAVAGVLRPRMLGFVVAYAGFEVWRALSGDDGGASFGCHIGGFTVGFVMVVLLRVADSDALEAA